MGSAWSRSRTRAVSAGLAFALGACSPTFDWRENLAEGTGLVSTFPCRPDRHSRSVLLGGKPVQIEMLVCSAGGATFALSFLDAADAAGVRAGLADLQTALLANIGAAPAGERPLALRGAETDPAPRRLRADGRGPDGAAVHLEAAFFAKGLRVYQAAIVGLPLKDDVTDPFFEGLKIAG